MAVKLHHFKHVMSQTAQWSYRFGMNFNIETDRFLLKVCYVVFRSILILIIVATNCHAWHPLAIKHRNGKPHIYK